MNARIRIDTLIIVGSILVCLGCLLGFLGILTDTVLIIGIGILGACNLAFTAILVWILIAFARFLDRAARK